MTDTSRESPRRIPVVTLILIVANIVAAYALYIYPDFGFEFGFRPDKPRPIAAITGLFLHANVFHLLANMIFLAAVGAAVEIATGSIRFAAVYFISGLVGVGVHYLVYRNATNPAPLIGASGSIAGCAAYYCVRYTRMRVAIAPKLALSVATVTGLWVLLQIAGAFIRIGDSAGGASFWAHLGGFATGIALSLVFRAPDFGHLKLGHAVLEKMNERGPGAVITAAEQHLSQHPRDIKILWELASAQQQLGEGDAEAETLLRLLDVVGADETPEVLRRLCQVGRVTRLTPLRRLQFADRVAATTPAVTRALLRSVVDGKRDENQRPDAILALASLEWDENPDQAKKLIDELNASYPIHPATDLARKRGWIA